MKIGDRIFVRGYIDEIRKDTVIVRNDGGYFGTIPSEVITGELPPAPPERIKGRWISADAIFGGVPFYCSECGENTRDTTVMGKPRWNFCPNCGAEMEVTT